MRVPVATKSSIGERVAEPVQANTNTDGQAISLSQLNRWFGGNGNAELGADISEVTYFVCLKTLTEAIGKLPVYLQAGDYTRVHNDMSYFLDVAPNPVQTASEFYSYLEFQRNHYGNGYAYIVWDRLGRLAGLYPLDARNVRIYVNDTDMPTDHQYYYEYMCGGKSYKYTPDEIIHVKNWLTTSSGYAGKSVRDVLNNYMGGNKAAQKFQNDLYKHGLRANLVVKYVGDLDSKGKRKLVEDLRGADINGDSRVIRIPVGWEVNPIDLKLTDSQFLETRQYSALQIAAAFGIKPNFLNDYSKSSYANSASQNTSFYTDTLLYIITAYEKELTRKLLTRSEIAAGLEIKMNPNVILRADPVQQAEMLAKYVGGSIYTINEARGRAGLPPVDNGDCILTASGYSTIDNVKEKL